jgi:hypothetical protein
LEDNDNDKAEQPADVRNMYIALISFEIPQAGTTQIFAKNMAHARELLTEAHKEVKAFTIHDIFDSKEYQEKMAHVDTQTPQTLN